MKHLLSLILLYIVFAPVQTQAQEKKRYEEQPWRKFSGQVRAYTTKQLEKEGKYKRYYFTTDTIDQRGNVLVQLMKRIYITSGDTTSKEDWYQWDSYDDKDRIVYRIMYRDDDGQVERDTMWWHYGADGRDSSFVKHERKMGDEKAEHGGAITTYNDAMHTDTVRYYDIVNGIRKTDFINVHRNAGNGNTVEEWQFEGDKKEPREHTIRTYNKNGDEVERITYSRDGNIYWHDKYRMNKYGINETIYQRFLKEIEFVTNTYERFDEHNNYRRHMERSSKRSSVTDIDILYR